MSERLTPAQRVGMSDKLSADDLQRIPGLITNWAVIVETLVSDVTSSRSERDDYREAAQWCFATMKRINSRIQYDPPGRVWKDLESSIREALSRWPWLAEKATRSDA